jgi:hypothetical protein
MLGGMTGYDDESLARSYFMAGGMLIEQVLTTGERGQEVICPILYVYRHGIELYLKVIIRPAERNHSIGSLLDAFCRHIKSQYGERVPSWITRPVGQLAEFDPGSDLFRYGQTKPSSISQKLTNSGEFWVDLRTLKRTMSLVEDAFRRVLVADAEGLEGLRRLGPRPT